MKEQTAARKRNTAGLRPQWTKGQSGNPAGRPKGARNALGEDFIRDLQHEWAQRGTASLKELDGAKLCEIVAKVLPKEMTLDVGDTYTDLLRRATAILADRGA